MGVERAQVGGDTSIACPEKTTCEERIEDAIWVTTYGAKETTCVHEELNSSARRSPRIQQLTA